MSLLYLSRSDLEDACPDFAEVIAAVRDGVLAHANGRAVAVPTLALPVDGVEGALYTIRGAALDLDVSAVKSVGSFPSNRAQGLPPDPGLLLLHDMRTGIPKAILEGSFITTVRTAAMTALGAMTVARPQARVLGCIGARGIAPLAARMLAESMALDEVRFHSASPESRETAAHELAATGTDARAVDSWAACVDGADIVIDGPGLSRHQPLFPSKLIAPGAAVISYGGFSSYDSEILANVDRVVMDRWAEGGSGPLGPFIAAGAFTKSHVDAWFGDIIAGRAQARTDDAQRVLLWHRGLGVCDITLAARLMARAGDLGLGTTLRYP